MTQRLDRSGRTKRVPLRALAITDGTAIIGHILRDGGRWLAFDASQKLIGKFATQIEARRRVPSLVKQADTILCCANCDTVTGARKDKHYWRSRRAEAKRLARLGRAKQKKFGKFGAASPGRNIPPDTC